MESDIAANVGKVLLHKERGMEHKLENTSPAACAGYQSTLVNT